MNLFITNAHYFDKLFSSAGLSNFGRKWLRLKHHFLKRLCFVLTFKSSNTECVSFPMAIQRFSLWFLYIVHAHLISMDFIFIRSDSLVCVLRAKGTTHSS